MPIRFRVCKDLEWKERFYAQLTHSKAMLTSLSVSLTHNPSPKQTITAKAAWKPCCPKVLTFFSDSGITHRMRARNRIKIQRVLGSKDRRTGQGAYRIQTQNPWHRLQAHPPHPWSSKRQGCWYLHPPWANHCPQAHSRRRSNPLHPLQQQDCSAPSPSQLCSQKRCRMSRVSVCCACTKGKVVRREDGEWRLLT